MADDSYTNILNTAVQPVDVRKFSQVFGAAEFVAVDKEGNMYGGEPRPRKIQKYIRVR